MNYPDASIGEFFDSIFSSSVSKKANIINVLPYLANAAEYPLSDIGGGK